MIDTIGKLLNYKQRCSAHWKPGVFMLWLWDLYLACCEAPLVRYSGQCGVVGGWDCSACFGHQTLETLKNLEFETGTLKTLKNLNRSRFLRPRTLKNPKHLMFSNVTLFERLNCVALLLQVYDWRGCKISLTEWFLFQVNVLLSKFL